MKPVVKEFLDALPDEVRLEFLERAAIIEYDGNFSREKAEWLTLQMYKRKLNKNKGK
jgi:hypothetical protein